MKNSVQAELAPRLVLNAATAADLMVPNPISIRANASVREATTMLTEKGFSAAPVIDHTGRPVGVLSHSDLLVHHCEQVANVRSAPAYYEPDDLNTPAGERLANGVRVEEVDGAEVRDLMTPVVFSVAPNTPTQQVVDQMLSLKVHRLFVVDRDGVLVGVISALDVLRHIRS